MDKKNIISEIIGRIETRFPGVIVSYCGKGYPDEDFEDVEIFHAYMVSEDEKEAFRDFAWELEENLAEPGDVSIMIHDMPPAETREYHEKELNEELRKRKKAQQDKVA
jgi:hypothetical protein